MLQTQVLSRSSNSDIEMSDLGFCGGVNRAKNTHTVALTQSPGPIVPIVDSDSTPIVPDSSDSSDTHYLTVCSDSGPIVSDSGRCGDTLVHYLKSPIVVR